MIGSIERKSYVSFSIRRKKKKKKKEEERKKEERKIWVGDIPSQV